MRHFTSKFLAFVVLISNTTPVRAVSSASDQNAPNEQSKYKENSTDGTTFRFQDWFKKRREQKSSQYEQNRRPSPQTFEEYLKQHKAEKVLAMVDTSVLLAVQQVVAKEYRSSVEKVVSDVVTNYGSYVGRPELVENHSQAVIDQLTRKLFTTQYQEILNRAHGIATGNLAKWSKEATAVSPEAFPNEYKLYEMLIADIDKEFKRRIDKNVGQVEAVKALGLIRSSLLNELQRVSALKFQGGNTEARAVVLRESSKNGTVEKVIPGSKTNVIIDLSEGKTKVSSNFSTATVEIPEMKLSEILSQNPETLRYKLRKPVAGLTHFATQSILFNIPLFFVTVAMVGLDSAKNPMAIEQFVESLKDPVVSMGFGLFILTNHKVAQGFHQLVKNPGLRFLAGPLGMASGMLAQSVFTELWTDKDIRGCARSFYNPQVDNAESCNKAWMNWIATNKISQYTPQILGLLSTAFSAGLLQKYGGMAVSAAAGRLMAAEQELAGLMKEALNQDPLVQKSKATAAKGMASVREWGQKTRDTEVVKSLIEKAKKQVANAKLDLELAKDYAQFYKQAVGEGWALAKGRLNVRITGIWAVAKETFRSKADLQAYLLKLKKLKGLVSFSVVSIGANLVFLSVDPFVSEPLHSAMAKSDMTDFNIKSFLEERTFFDNYSEMISAFFSHNLQLPHEKDYQTLPQVFKAYNLSLETFLKNSFQSQDLLKCYLAETPKVKQDEKELPSWVPDVIRKPISAVVSKVQKSNDWLVDSRDAVIRYLFNQGLYQMDPECVVRSDFRPWLDKYSEMEKGWRTVALSQVLNSSQAWSETIANFLVNYETTKEFYSFMAGLIHDHREARSTDPATPLPKEEISRDAILANVQAISHIPLRESWKSEETPRFEALFPDSLGDYDTPEYGDFLVASMACGPDPRQPVSFMQKVRSLSWFPWESVSHLAPSVFSTWQTAKPSSPIIETYPGTSFKYLPPRITTGDPAEICDEAMREDLAPRGRGAFVSHLPAIYSAPIKTKMARYENLIDYIFKNAREDIVKSENLVDDFFRWNRDYSTSPIFDEKTGVWPVVKKNYENLMKHHFLPVLKDTSLRTPCPGQGGIHCALTEDVYLRANGLIYSGMNELYTYIRTLRKVLGRLSEVSEGDPAFAGLEFFRKGEFEELARSIPFTLLDKNSQPTSFDYEETRSQLERLRFKMVIAVPQTELGIGALQIADAIFEKMNGVVGELEGYRRYSQLTFKIEDLPPPAGQDSSSKSNPYDRRFRN